MNPFLIYSLKSLFAMGIFALVYRFGFIHESNLRHRRFYLLGALFTAFFLPVMHIRFESIISVLPEIRLDEITVTAGNTESGDASTFLSLHVWIGYLYFFVFGLFFLKLTIQLIRILLSIRRSKPLKTDWGNVYHQSENNLSYSFFSNIFIGSKVSKEDMEQILEHEKVHVLQWHSLDVIFIEILCCLFWFNPFLWWYRQEIKNVHEYLADEGVLNNGINIKSYQVTLLENLIGSPSISLSNNFNYSQIKNRIAMMNTIKKNRKNHWKIFLLIPVSLILVFAFACTDYGDERSGLIEESLIIESQPDEIAQFPGGEGELRKFIATNLRYPVTAWSKGVSGRVVVQFIVDKNGRVVTDDENPSVIKKEGLTSLGEIVVAAYSPGENHPEGNVEKEIEDLKLEAIRVISKLPEFKPAMKNGEPVNVLFTIPINFVLQ